MHRAQACARAITRLLTASLRCARAVPTNDTTTPHTFALDTLLGYMRQRAAQHGVTLPAQLYLIDISLNNPFDGDYSVEQDFWKSAPASVGKLLPWPLGLAGILPPSVYNESERREMANASVWKVDKIPERIADIRTMLHTDWPVPGECKRCGLRGADAQPSRVDASSRSRHLRPLQRGVRPHGRGDWVVPDAIQHLLRVQPQADVCHGHGGVRPLAELLLHER